MRVLNAGSLVPVLRSLCAGSVFAEVHSDGPIRVVLLHGWGRSRQDFRALVRSLPAIAFDLPGFGASPEPPSAWGASGYATFVADALGELSEPGPFVFVGHSFGGRVATCLAAQRPDLVRGMVLCGVPLIRLAPGARSSFGFRLARRANRIGLMSDRRMEALRNERGSSDYRAASGVMRDVLVTVVNESYESQLAQIQAPVVLLWGEDDTATPPAIAERALACLQGDATLRVVSNVGHDLHLEKPLVVESVVVHMLEAGSS